MSRGMRRYWWGSAIRKLLLKVIVLCRNIALSFDPKFPRLSFQITQELSSCFTSPHVKGSAVETITKNTSIEAHGSLRLWLYCRLGCVHTYKIYHLKVTTALRNREASAKNGGKRKRNTTLSLPPSQRSLFCCLMQKRLGQVHLGCNSYLNFGYIPSLLFSRMLL